MDNEPAVTVFLKICIKGIHIEFLVVIHDAHSKQDSNKN